MKNNHVMLISKKETFLIRAIEKKLQEARINFKFVTWSVDELNHNWANTDLIKVYMDEGDFPPDDVMHFLLDRMADEEKKMIAIGGKDENQYMCDHVPGDILYKSFIRPLDNDAYIETVKNVFRWQNRENLKRLFWLWMMMHLIWDW